MAGADWSIAVGILVYFVAIIVAAMYYYRYEKIYLIFHISAISTYVFAVFYTWDVFELNKNYVLGMLIVSTVIMVLLGKYFGKFNLKPTKPHTSLKEKENERK